MAGVMLAGLLTSGAHAAAKSNADQPIEVSSDKLDVLQDQHKAIFTGNVIAVQGASTMRSAVMTVFYSDGATGTGASSGQSISRIEATGDVVFTTPTETARGERGIYDVAADTINLTGATVTLTRGGNILKGTNLTYNMSTGRSVLTSGNGATEVGATATAPTGKPARVHGLFLPGGEKK